MKTRADISVDGDEYEVSLSKMLPEGVSIKDITGRISKEYGQITFQLYKVVLSDGTNVWCEGEHDFPYLTECKHIDPLMKHLTQQTDD